METERWWRSSMSRSKAPAVSRMLPCVSMTPFGSAVVPEVNTTSKSVSRSGAGHASTWASQSAGKASSGSSTSSSSWRTVKSVSPTSAGSGASRPRSTTSQRVSARCEMRSMTPGVMRRSRGTRTMPARMAPQ